MPDFTNEIEIAGAFATTEEDAGVDFTPSGDDGQIVVTVGGFGIGGFGDGPFGETTTLILNAPTTYWTNIDTP